MVAFRVSGRCLILLSTPAMAIQQGRRAEDQRQAACGIRGCPGPAGVGQFVAPGNVADGHRQHLRVGAAVADGQGRSVSGIQRNTTYYLYETQAPSNYMTAGPWILVVGDKDATLYPATEKPDGTLEKAGDGTPLTVSDSGTDTKVLPVTIRDISWGYELPNTGGAGTTSYTAGGLALIFGAATLLYSHCRRRKEDEASS